MSASHLVEVNKSTTFYFLQGFYCMKLLIKQMDLLECLDKYFSVST